MRITARSTLRLVCLAGVGALVLATGALAGAPGEISSSEALALQKTGAPLVFVDVRTPEEFAAGHVPGAINVPRDQLPQRLAEFDAAQDTVVLYCERGPRALAAAATLKSAGFTKVRHLTGDMSGWRSAGLPVEK